jgi:hypothetical protein
MNRQYEMIWSIGASQSRYLFFLKTFSHSVIGGTLVITQWGTAASVLEIKVK